MHGLTNSSLGCGMQIFGRCSQFKVKQHLLIASIPVKKYILERRNFEEKFIPGQE